ncbi:MAG: GNAT family N-acetyltransferase [Blastopirellula sp. JB062]
MSLPLRLTKRLSPPPADWAGLPATIVPFAQRPDVDAWLRLHGEIFLAGKARWSAERFRRELTARPWFAASQMWWGLGADQQCPAGAVTLEIDGEQGRIHWLMVDQAARRRQIASRLLDVLERSAWAAGVRQLSAETLSSWTAAVHFYRRRHFSTGS